jgi:hypothetical protein
MTRKGGAKLSPPLKSASPDFAQWPDAGCGNGVTGCEQNARQIIPDSFLNISRRPRDFRKCFKPIKLRLTLFLQPNHGFGESFCGSGSRRPHKYFQLHYRPR